MTPVWACRAFWCLQLPIYANSYLHVSLKLPSVTLFHITHYYILIHIKYPHKLSLIFHHLMFISVHTMLLYIVFFIRIVYRQSCSFKLSRITWHFLKLPSPRDTPCFVFQEFLVYPFLVFFFFEFAITYIKDHIKMQYCFFFVHEMSLAARIFLFM